MFQRFVSNIQFRPTEAFMNREWKEDPPGATSRFETQREVCVSDDNKQHLDSSLVFCCWYLSPAQFHQHEKRSIWAGDKRESLSRVESQILWQDWIICSKPTSEVHNNKNRSRNEIHEKQCQGNKIKASFLLSSMVLYGTVQLNGK